MEENSELLLPLNGSDAAEAGVGSVSGSSEDSIGDADIDADGSSACWGAVVSGEVVISPPANQSPVELPWVSAGSTFVPNSAPSDSEVSQPASSIAGRAEGWGESELSSEAMSQSAPSSSPPHSSGGVITRRLSFSS